MSRVHPLADLSGRVVVVTGAGRGIGRSVAIEAHRLGAHVAVGSRTLSELEALRDEITADGGGCFIHPLDVTSVASIEEFVAAVVEAIGPIHGLVNNAGDNIGAAAIDFSEADFDHLVAVNFKSAYFMSCRVASVMRDHAVGGGSIVNISSQAGCVGAPGRAPYSGAKAAVNNVTRTLAAEWASFGVRVNAVAPTFTRTPLAESILAGNPDLARSVVEKILLGRPAEPVEIAKPAVFLLSDAAAMITGHTLVVDGGWTIV